jgi:flagellar motor switch protein FliN
MSEAENFSQNAPGASGSSGRPHDGQPPGHEAILRIPVTVQVVLGSARMPVAHLMKLGRGAVVALDQRVGEPVNVVVNGRVVARGEVVVVDEDQSRFGVSLTEIAGSADADAFV